MKQLTYFLLVVSACLPASSILAMDDFDRPSISVTGTAVTRTEPDTIVWTITTTDEHKELAIAKKASDESTKRIAAIREELKIDPEQLTMGRLRVEKIYNKDQYRNNTTFKHFRVQREFTLRQSDLKRFDEFLTKIVDGPVEVGFVFESSRIHEIRNETRIKAMKLAKAKATAMAHALDSEVGKPIKINEVKMNIWQRASFGNAVYSDPEANTVADDASGAIVPDMIEVKISVDVVFELK